MDPLSSVANNNRAGGRERNTLPPQRQSNFITDEQQESEEINLNEHRKSQQLLNVDEENLAKQLNKDNEPNNRRGGKERTIAEDSDSQNLKSILKKSRENEDKYGCGESAENSEKPSKIRSSREEIKDEPNESSSEEEEYPINRKRKFHECDEEDLRIRSELKKNLQQTIVPDEKINKFEKKRLNKRSKYSNESLEGRVTDLSKARRRRDRNRRGEPESSESDDSSSSDDSVSSEEAQNLKTSFTSHIQKLVSKSFSDDIMKDYMKDVIFPMLIKEREQSKKETLELLKEQGLIKTIENKEPDNKDPNKDPFLEDEGFFPSDISGNTTPKRSVSISISQGSGNKNTFKKVRTSSSQERKLLGTPKRNETMVKLQKQVIKPNEEDKEPVEFIDTKKVDIFKKKEIGKESSKPKESEKDMSIFAGMRNESRTKSSSLMFGKKDSKSKVESAKHSLFNMESKPDTSKPEEKAARTPLFDKTDIKVGVVRTDNEAQNKPQLSIFNRSKESVEEMIKSRASNNSSPEFGESKNTVKADEDKPKKAPSKPVSLFTTKVTPIAESAEEDDASQEDKSAKPLVKSLFTTTESKPVNPEEKKEEDDKKKIHLNLSSNATDNPFLKKIGGNSKPTNLFSNGGDDKPKTENKPQVSLFNSENKLGGSSNPTSLFNNASSASQPSLFKTESKAISGMAKIPSTSVFKGVDNMETEDVGMGGVTPPTQSPMRIPEKVNENKIFPFSNNPGPSTLFGNQGSSGASLNTTGSLFGNASTGGSQSLFNIGAAKTETKTPFNNPSGNMGSNPPNQGQPDLN